jgi:hypothetical protein
VGDSVARGSATASPGRAPLGRATAGHSEHLVHDFGGMSRAMAAVFGVAVATLDPAAG